MVVEGPHQAFQRLPAQAFARHLQIAVGLDQDMVGKVQHLLRHIVADHLALLRHAKLGFLPPAGRQQGIKLVFRPAFAAPEEIANCLAAPEHFTDVRWRRKQRMNQGVETEALAIDRQRPR